MRMQRSIKGAAWFAGGLATGLGIALVTASAGHAAMACVSVVAVLCAGVMVGRASAEAVPPTDPDDIQPEDFPLVPDRPIPMDHEHGAEA